MIWRKTALIFFVFFTFHLTTYPSKVDSLYNIIENTTDPVKQVELFIEIGDLYEFSDPPKAIYYYTKAYEISNSIRETSGYRRIMPQAEFFRAKSLRFIGIVYSDAGNFKDALDKFFEARKVLEDLKALYTIEARSEIELKMAKLFSNIGIVYSKQSLFDLAKEYYQQALAVYVELQDKKSIAVVYSSLGIVEARQAHIPEALEYFRKALDIYTQIDDKEGIAQTYNNIGNMHMHHSNYQEALELYQQAFDGFSEMKFINRMGAVANNIARALQNLGEKDQAKFYYNKSVALRREVNDMRGLSETYSNLGGLYFEQGEYEQATQYFQKALDVSRELGDNYHLAIAYINIGRVAAKAGNINDAILKTREGMNLAIKHNLRFLIAMAMHELADYYAQKNDYATAFRLSREHYQLSQSILNEEKLRQISELEIGFQAREKQQQIELLEQETQINQMRLRQSEIWIFVMALVFLVLLISGIFTVVYMRQRNKILLKNKERETNLVIKKTGNDLQAVINSYAHALMLLDDKLNVIALNPLSIKWFEVFMGYSIAENDSLYSVPNSIINDLVNDFLFYSLRGEIREKNIEFTSLKDKKKYLYKIYSSPVFDESEHIIQSVSLIIEEVVKQQISNRPEIVA